MSSKTFQIEKLWKPALIVVGLVFLYFSVIVKLVTDWSTDENYSHGLLVPFIIAYIIWTKRKELSLQQNAPQYVLGGVLTVGALFVLLAGTLGAELFVQRISMVLMLASVIIYFYGITILRMVAIPFLLLLLSIPIPQIIFNKIAFPLQIYASQLAVWMIRISGVPVLRKGNVIDILPRNAVQVIALEVVEACSGIRSLMTLVTLALILVYFTRTKSIKPGGSAFAFLKNFDFWRGVVLMLLAVPIAIFTNASRVAATGILAFYFGDKATKGLAHDAAGWIVFAVALILLVACNFLLSGIFLRVANGKEQ
ncbi:MAG: exosortase/archaeosortase family protein [Pyrinomonadaceae bacterium]